MIRKYPVEGHPLGTDELGRDLLLRILWGGRTSITIALAATVVSSVLGIILGAIPAYYGGATDSIIMRTLDVFMAIPSMLLMITLVNIMKPTTFNLIIAMSISGVPSIARIVRGQMLSVMRNEYVEAVRGMGASGVRIVVKHVLPNAISPLIAQIVSSVAGEITMISTLSYIGLGVQQPAPEWGSMLAAGQQFIRDQPYRAADNPAQSCRIARNMIFGKLYNARWSIERTKRDHALRVDPARLQAAIDQIKTLYPLVADEISMESLRGSEGIGAKAYFDVFDEMILQNKADFFFRERNRRPPLDNVNAMLSFAYSLLANDCAAALEAVGLDAYVGFLHRDRPGRTSLALDLMEELRPCFADRFVLSLINNRVMQKGDFEHTDSGAVLLTADGRKKFLQAWQERKRETITHPYLKEKLTWGLVPYVQALLLARYLRDDLDAYPPFLWK